MARKGGLGKGLDALIPGKPSQQSEEGTVFIAINDIIPNPRQPRHTISFNRCWSLMRPRPVNMCWLQASAGYGQPGWQV